MKISIAFQYRRSGGPGRESGVALILALISLLVMSTLAVGVLYSTQSEVWTTANYRAVTQARYIAEAGAQQALNYLQTAATPPIVSSLTATYGSSVPYFTYATGMPILYTPSGCTAPYTVTPPPPAYSATACRPVIMATNGMSAKYQDTYAAIDTVFGTNFDFNFQSAFTSTTTQLPFQGLTNCTGPSCPSFSVAVQLLAAFQDPSSGKWVTRWKIVSEGTLNTLAATSTSAGHALVQVVEVVDNVMVNTTSGSSPTYSAGVVATGTGCGAITMSGGTSTNSYVGATQSGVAAPTLSNTGGNVSTMGNINLSGGASIIGNVYSPYYNAGTAGTYGISGGPWPGLNSSAACVYPGTMFSVNEDNSGSGVGCTAQTVGCSQKTLPMATPLPTYPTPCLPSGNCPSVPATVAANTTEPTGSSAGIWYGLLGGGSGGGHGCSVTVAPSGGTAGGFTSPANFGAVNFGGCSVITLQPGVYNMDSLYISNGAKLILPTTGLVTINILDQGATTNPINMDGGTVSNTGGNPGNFVIVYAGSKPIDISAGASMFATIYAPNSAATMSGAGGLYGALISKTANFSGSGTVNYDSSLNGTGIPVTTPPNALPGPLHVDEYSWSAF